VEGGSPAPTMTDISAVSVRPALDTVTVMVAVPATMPVTVAVRPLPLTVAM